jgi:hypothetical protein
MHRSVSTVNADAAQRLFGARGQGVVWAVVDSGIDAEHRHFQRHSNLELPGGLEHRDFTAAGSAAAPLRDGFGHGTAVAGIIAGALSSDDGRIVGMSRRRNEEGMEAEEQSDLHAIAGMAPECKLLSMKVLDERGAGSSKNVVDALQAIQEMNAYGQLVRVHGVNLSVAFEWEPDLEVACGLSPMCIEIDRLVRAGVVVVVAAGNTEYGSMSAMYRSGLAGTIADPGNAERAITVGATHRDMPQVYGISYFSSKGPTLDGRMKPDLVAPGERIMTCSTGRMAANVVTGDEGAVATYREDSGTAHAAAHVSGLAAAFLSVRRDLIGRPDDVKQYLLASTTDLGRTPGFQGRGLVNLLGALELPAMPAARPPGTTAPTPDLQSVLPATISDSGRRALKLMCSYSHRDEVLWDEFRAHLAPLRRQALVELWHDRKILPGAEWDREIARELQEADIILLLVSAYFIDSDYCYDIELRRAIERHEAGQVRVIPVIVRPADWSGTPFAKLQAVPKDGKPVTSWADQHEAWADVTKGIRSTIESSKHR